MLSRIFSSAAFLLASAAQALAAPVVEGVPPRELADPKSVVSLPLAGAAPVPLADGATRRDLSAIPHHAQASDPEAAARQET